MVVLHAIMVSGYFIILLASGKVPQPLYRYAEQRHWIEKVPRGWRIHAWKGFGVILVGFMTQVAVLMGYTLLAQGLLKTVESALKNGF